MDKIDINSMSPRYKIIPVIFNGHPQWGHSRGFRIKDTATGILSISWYTDEETARFYCNKKNTVKELIK